MVDADPYRWPYDGVLDPSRLALVITGAQPAWIDRSRRADTVAGVVAAVADAVRASGGLVVHVRHGGITAGRSGLPPARQQLDWQLATSIHAGDVVIDAAGVDGFYGSSLDSELRRCGRDHLVLTGFGAEATVNSTLRSANDRGYECLTLTDACAPFDDAIGLRCLHSITMSGGIFGAIAESAALLAPLDALVPHIEPTLTEVRS